MKATLAPNCRKSCRSSKFSRLRTALSVELFLVHLAVVEGAKVRKSDTGLSYTLNAKSQLLSSLRVGALFEKKTVVDIKLVCDEKAVPS